MIDGVRDEALRTIPGIRRLSIKEMGADVMASSAAPIQVIIFGPDLAKLAEMGEQVRALAEEIPGFVQASTSWAMTLPQLHVEVDRARAQELGLTVEEVANQAYYALKGGLTNEYYRVDNQRLFTILLRYRDDQRKDRQDLEQVKIVGKRGEVVPLALAGPPGGAAGADPHRARQLPARRVHPGVLPQGRDRPAWISPWICSWRPTGSSTCRPGTGSSCAGDMTQMEESFQRLLRGSTWPSSSCSCSWWPSSGVCWSRSTWSSRCRSC